MKITLLWIAMALLSPGLLLAQETPVTDQQKKEISAVIDAYSQARAQGDRALLEKILMPDIDQLVSSGEWRRGREGSMQGMGRSSESNPGTRTLTVENIRLVSREVALVDARYEIRSPGGATRNMWSTFVVVRSDGNWRISAIRNMLPTNL